MQYSTLGNRQVFEGNAVDSSTFVGYHIVQLLAIFK